MLPVSLGLLRDLGLLKEGMHFSGSAVSQPQQGLCVHLHLHRRLGVSVHRAGLGRHRSEHQ